MTNIQTPSTEDGHTYDSLNAMIAKINELSDSLAAVEKEVTALGEKISDVESMNNELSDALSAMANTVSSLEQRVG